MGILALVAYLSEPLKVFLPIWAIVIIVAGPFILLTIQGGEQRIGARRTSEVLAAWWYVILTALASFYFVNGHRPPWWGTFVFFIILGLAIYVPKLRLADEPATEAAIEPDRNP
jgi:hypothetical protein